MHVLFVLLNNEYKYIRCHDFEATVTNNQKYGNITSAGRSEVMNGALSLQTEVGMVHPRFIFIFFKIIKHLITMGDH